MIPCWAEGSGFRLTQTPDGRQKRLDDLYEYGKKKGTLTYKEIMERLMDLYIEPDQLDKVFQMGYSTKFDSKTGNIYRGMGLTGAKMSLEEQLGGSVWVDSIQNERTTFWVRVPAANLAETAKKAKKDEVHS